MVLKNSQMQKNETSSIFHTGKEGGRETGRETGGREGEKLTKNE